MQKHSTIPAAYGLYWYFEVGFDEPRPVMINKARWPGSFKSFDGSTQNWMRDGEYLIGPQHGPAAQQGEVRG